jgi:hypothetical protein
MTSIDLTAGAWVRWGGVGVVTGVLAMALGGSAWAEGSTAGPGSELRVELMLAEDRVLGGSVDDPVWQFDLPPGRRLIQLPLRLLPGEAAGELDEPAVDFAGGRFLAWSIPASDDTPARRRAPAADVGPTDEQLSDLPRLLEALDRPAPSAADRGRPALTADTLPVRPAEVPEQAPRLARTIEVLPGTPGTPTAPRLAWEIERAIPNATVQSGDSVYHLYLSPEQLRELEPERPERLTREADESSQVFALRERASQAEYRQLLTEYRELLRTVRGLEDRLEQDLPPTVWAVFEVNDFGNGWTMRGTPAGDWSMPFDTFELVQDLAGNRGSRSGRSARGELSDTERDAVRQLTVLSRDPHPWSQRMLAAALAGSGYADQLTENYPASELFGALLRSPDPLARNQTVYTLASLDAPSEAVVTLLEAVADEADEPALHYAAVRSRLLRGWEVFAQTQDGATTPTLTDEMAIDTTLSDPGGLSADRVLHLLLVTSPDTAAAESALINGVSFGVIPEAELDAALAELLRSAEAYPVIVGGWVDRQLLGSAEPRLVDRTLAVLGRADAPAPAVGPLAQGLADLVLGPADASAEASAPPVVIRGGLPLTSTDHALFKLLSAGDTARRAAGWSALRHFELVDQASPGRRNARREATNQEAAVDPLTQIVDAGLGQADTPASLVPFLVRQPDAARTTGPLLRVVREGDASAAAAAARSLRGSGRDLAGPMDEMDPEERAALAGRVYESIGGGPTPVTGLLADAGMANQLTRWWAGAWSAGSLPAPADWAEQGGGRDRLLSVVAQPPEAPAHGAIAALTAAAGGDAELQRKMIDRFKEQRQTLSSSELETAWADAQRDIYMTRLASAAGDYTLTMRVSPTQSGGGPEADEADRGDRGDRGGIRATAVPATAGANPTDPAAGASAEAELTVLGLISLAADGRSIRFRGGVPELTVPDDFLALRIAEPAQLASLPVEALQALPLDDVDQPLDLRPQDGGGFVGDVPLPDGRRFALLLQPAKAKAEGSAPQTSPPQPSAEPIRNPFAE